MTNEEVALAITNNSSIYEGIRNLPTRKIDDDRLRDLVYDAQAFIEDLDISIEELEEYLEGNL